MYGLLQVNQAKPSIVEGQNPFCMDEFFFTRGGRVRIIACFIYGWTKQFIWRYILLCFIERITMKRENKDNKLIFFDIDGTLLGKGKDLPKSANDAIQAAKEKGNMVFLATGRSKGSIPRKILDLGFDGLVLGSGAYVEYEKEILFHEILDKRKVKELADYFKQEQAFLMFETNEASYMTEETKAYFAGKITREEFWDEEMVQEFTDHMRIEDDLEKIEGINKLAYFDFTGSKRDLVNAFIDDFTILPNSIMTNQESNSGEISKKGITKATGIECILRHIGADMKDVIAFGDGFNDMEMIQIAGTGVAMGNAVEELKEVADIVAPDMYEDGIQLTLKYLGVI